ncbi:MAG: hypothetical protein IJK40_01555 [Clostridia bacterium]|nr:hypothetical protein [Clostridia bacterium]MBR0536812.1 hypothetical protein [Clostridia bacterium]
MASCPNCGHKLKLTDISQFCPACGINMRFVNFEENFYREAKYAELAQANVKVKFRRFKAAFIGSKLTIVRLCAALLPVLALLVPNGSFTLTLPFYESKTDFGLMGLISLFTGRDFGYVMGQPGADFGALRTGLFGYLATALFAVVVLLATLLCFLSIKNMQKVICVLAGVGAAAAVCGMFLIKTADSLTVHVKGGFGLLAAVAAFGVVIAVNVILEKQGIPVEYAEGMEERAKLYKELKAGDLDLDSLPQPIIETAQTRRIDDEIAAEQEEYRKAHEKEVE